MNKKKIVVSVINDLATDQRVHKTCNTLNSMGFDVFLVGRKLSNSLPLNFRLYKTKRFSFPFNKGFIFYAFFNIRLFFFLLFSKVDVLLSNDLDTLPANYLVSVIKKIPIVYDSHEYFTEVPELINRSAVKKIWEKIESSILPKLTNAYTVSTSIADAYKHKYNVNFRVVRNVPELNELIVNKRENNKNVILYQGALNMGRGLEKVIEAMQFVENATLQIIGDGDIAEYLKTLSIEKNVNDKIIFMGRIPFEDLFVYTHNATVGLSIEEAKGLNYQYALPNKLFDYIHAGIPVIVSPLNEMKKIVEDFSIGIVLVENTPAEIAKTINYVLSNKEEQNRWRENTKFAAKQLCWQKEELIIKSIFAPFM